MNHEHDWTPPKGSYHLPTALMINSRVRAPNGDGATGDEEVQRALLNLRRLRAQQDYSAALNAYHNPKPADWTPPPQAAAYIKAQRAEQRRILWALTGLAASLLIGLWTGVALERFWTAQNEAAVAAEAMK